MENSLIICYYYVVKFSIEYNDEKNIEMGDFVECENRW